MKYKLYYKDSNPFVDEYINNELKIFYNVDPFRVAHPYVTLEEEEVIILKLKFPFLNFKQHEDAHPQNSETISHLNSQS